MGSVLSACKDNDELVNRLVYHNHISSRRVERAFRAVDRGDYISPSDLESAYRDMTSKVDNIHLSAPCVYGKVMERLSLKPGLSFLNIGSGTGYLSTIAAFILGDNGTNHGIEMHEDCFTYAQEHLEEFKRKSLDVDVFEFCEPVFTHGNFLNVIPNRQYDRVYCGAACPEIHEKFVKQFVKIGGILVMPKEDLLVRAKKTGEDTWQNNGMIPVSFASLMSPEDGNDQCLLQLPLCTPKSLQELCRSLIRRHLRAIVWAENKDFEEKQPVVPPPSMPMFPALSAWNSSLVIPIVDNDLPLQGEGIPESVQIAMNSSMRSILTECLRPFVSLESDDSSDDLESDDLFAPRRAMRPYSMREQSNSETRERDTSERDEYGFDGELEEDQDGEEEEDEDILGYAVPHCEESEETQNVTTEEETEKGCDKKENARDVKVVEEGEKNDEPSGSNRGQSTSCSIKRNASEKSSSSSEEDLDSADEDMSDGTIEALLQGDMLKKRRMLNIMENSNSIVSFSDDDNDDESSAPFMVSSVLKNLQYVSNKVRSLVRGNGDACPACSVVEPEKVEDKKDRIINVDSSDASSNEDEYDETNKANNRRDHRAGLKRRFERKALSSGSDGGSNFGKKLNLSESNDLGEISPSTVNSSPSSSAKKSSTSGYSFLTGPNSSNDDVQSDSDSDTYFSHRESNLFVEGVSYKKTHVIKKDVFASCMKQKVSQLPIPPPLRLYINYNREFV
ncbi:uncharacterized protein [Venturia canescens]|uniref:uncharacterized protein n=1 Tax=Venturia canescens TaxID=32260 RepID=UPI001C9C2F92|nr:uncharacterized protein LOC122407328 [Venturia canescens]XP_043269404.1 uncharacterized protein LOC122407328 [Venturia canescens]XP_043269406.1 uncharacterized protein LOC122407328 [Venturia canescens]